MEEMIYVEKLRAGDVFAVANLLNSLVPWEITEEAAETACRKLLDNADSAVFVAKEQNTIIGTATAICCTALAAKFLVIEDVIVAPGKTGNGIGSMLMEAVDAFARERNCLYGILVSSGHRVDAHRFYQKHGFTEDVRGFRKGY